MTAAEPAPDDGFADLVDDLLQQIQDGHEPDLLELAAAHPLAAARVDEAHALACSLAGRRGAMVPKLAGYVILRELGHGGMGTVYLARHESLLRDVALKVLPNTVWQSTRSRQRFLAEARALARLSHDHIVRIHRVLDHGRLLAFEMEFVDGPSLAAVLGRLRQGPKPVGLGELAAAIGVAPAALRARSAIEFFVQVGVQIARALAHAHTAGLVHRDVKPANILLRADGRPLLADFGLAHVESSDLTRTNCFVGTPTYSAPEQLRVGTTIDARADVYALGVTLYEAISLQVPFAGSSTTEVLRAIESGKVSPLRRVAPAAPRDLETVLAKAMELDPARRYPTADAFADDLERILSLQPVHALPASPLRRTVQFARRNQLQFVSALLGAVLVLCSTIALSLWSSAEVHALARSRAALQRARLALLDAVGPVLHRRTGDPPLAALVQAQADYDAALGDDPATGVVQRERDVVAAVRWLRGSSPQRRDRILDEPARRQLQQFEQQLLPVTGRVLRQLVTGDVDLQRLAADLRDSDAADPYTTGLLGFLLGDLPLCEAGWSDQQTDNRDLPLLDAGLGMVLLADNHAERAYVRLFHASRAFPESTELRLHLASAAVASNEIPAARRHVAALPAAADQPQTIRRERLLADLAAASGDLERAHAAHLAHQSADPTDPVPRHRLAHLALAAGDAVTARELLRELAVEQPQTARYRLELARLALECGDVAGYLAAAVDVVAQDFGRGRSTGTRADLLEILRIGGLDELHRRGRERAQLPMAPVWSGLSRPIWPALARVQRPMLEPLVAGLGAILGDLGQFEPAMPGKAIPGNATRSACRHLPGAAGPLLAALPWPLVVGSALAVDPGLRAAATRSYLRWFPPRAPRAPTHSVPPLLRGAADPNLTFAFAIAWSPTPANTACILVGNPPRDVTVSAGTVFACDPDTGRTLAELRCPEPDVLFGFDVASIGDVDGDGVADWLVGAPLGSGRGSGRAFVYSGRTHQLLDEVPGDAAGFGVSVAGLGDCDGDGVRDFVVGLSPELRNQAALGQARVYSGRDRRLLFVCRSDRSGCWFGARVAAVDDVDGDGCADLLVAGNHGNAPGLVQVRSGRDGSVLRTFADDTTTAQFGEVACGLGDLDGDGRPEIAVGAPGLAERTRGRVLIYRGSDGSLLRELRSQRIGDRFGAWVARCDDVDGDGIPDLAVAIPGGGPNGSGELLVLSGRNGAELSRLANAAPNSSFASRIAVQGDRLALAGAADGGHGSLFVTTLSVGR